MLPSFVLMAKHLTETETRGDLPVAGYAATVVALFRHREGLK